MIFLSLLFYPDQVREKGSVLNLHCGDPSDNSVSYYNSYLFLLSGMCNNQLGEEFAQRQRQLELLSKPDRLFLNVSLFA